MKPPISLPSGQCPFSPSLNVYFAESDPAYSVFEGPIGTMGFAVHGRSSPSGIVANDSETAADPASIVRSLFFCGAHGGGDQRVARRVPAAVARRVAGRRDVLRGRRRGGGLPTPTRPTACHAGLGGAPRKFPLAVRGRGVVWVVAHGRAKSAVGGEAG